MFISWNRGAPFCNFEYLIQGNSQIFFQKMHVLFENSLGFVLVLFVGTYFSSVQFSCSVVSDALQPHESQHARPPCPSPTPGVYWNSCPLSADAIQHLVLCRPIFLLPPIPPSIRVFSNESTLCMRWPEFWSFSFSTSPSNKHPVLISFRMDWLYLLAVQGTLRSLLQHHSLKASTFLKKNLFILFLLFFL